jgi:hypothetical protein
VIQANSSDVPAILYIQVAIGCLNLIAVAVGLTIAYRQLTRAHDWNRRKASQDLLIQLASGDIRALRGRLETTFDARIFDHTQTYSQVVARISDESLKAEFRYTTRTVLNYLETMGIGIKNSVLEDNTCYDYAAETVFAYWRWSKPLVEEVRPIAPLAWVNLEGLNERWGERYAARLRENKAALRLPARPPT